MFLNGSPHAVHDLWDVGAHHANLKVTCSRCGHWKVIHAAALWCLFQKKGWSSHLSEFSTRLCCGVCWQTHQMKVRPRWEIVEDEAGDDLPLPSEREWKVEAKRRR